MAGGIGQPFVTTDYPAVQRAVELRADALLVAKNGVDAVYSADPRLEPGAERFESLSYEEAVAKDLRIMDPSAFILAKEHRLPIHVFDIERTAAMTAILDGEPIGTEISAGALEDRSR